MKTGRFTVMLMAMLFLSSFAWATENGDQTSSNQNDPSGAESQLNSNHVTKKHRRHPKKSTPHKITKAQRKKHMLQSLHQSHPKHKLAKSAREKSRHQEKLHQSPEKNGEHDFQNEPGENNGAEKSSLND